jgi:hypothetical protein
MSTNRISEYKEQELVKQKQKRIDGKTGRKKNRRKRKEDEEKEDIQMALRALKEISNEWK